MSNYRNFLIANGNEIAVIAFLTISVLFVVVAFMVVRKILYRLSPAGFKYINFIHSVRYSLNNGFHRIDEFNDTIYAKYYNNGFYLFVSRIIKFIFSVFFIKNKNAQPQNYLLLDLLFENDRLAKEAIKKGYRPVAAINYPYIYFVFHGSILSKDDYMQGKTVTRIRNNDDSYSYYDNDDFDFYPDELEVAIDHNELLNSCPIDDFGNVNIYDDVDVSNAMNS
jgi:hypothetical protein